MLPLTELGQGRQGQLNEMGGVKWVSSPISGWRVENYHSNVKCSYLLSSTYADYEGGLYTLQSSQANIMPKWKTQSTRLCSFKQWRGVYMKTPITLHLTIETDSRYLPQTDNDSCTYKKTVV